MMKISLDFTLWLLMREIKPPGKTQALAWSAVWSDTRRIGNSLAVNNPVFCMNRCKTLLDLTTLHDRWSTKLNKFSIDERVAATIAKYGTALFPMPPLIGTNTIIPITTAKELFQEGADMHHCVASYAGKIMQNQCYIYRILEPERATVEIGYENGTLLLNQIKLINNGKPSEETVEVVSKWIFAAAEKLI